MFYSKNFSIFAHDLTKPAICQEEWNDMGIYINKGNEDFQRILNSEYVDKTGLIAIVNATLFTEQCFSCVTRCRRFGKTLAAKMLCAYYDHSCDSRSLFADLQIASDPSFEKHLNKYPVIYLDMTRFTTQASDVGIVKEIEKRLTAEIVETYPDIPRKEDDDMMDFLLRVADRTGERFVFIIDEWDAICRIYTHHTRGMDEYVNWLRRMFKDVTAMKAFAGVYMTGILPIKKYETQSALNNFIEYSMREPMNMGRFFGFTKEEVRVLAEKHGMDFDELEKWYDGYQIGDELSMFNPYSVMQAVDIGRCRSFWVSTGSFDAVANYIKMNFDGLKDDIICMLGGGRVKVNPTKFQNDMSDIRSKDDVLTVLIHLGYLSYNWRRDECYVPNLEVAGELVNAVEENKWEHVANALKQSEQLLEATLACDADTVAAMGEAVHTENTSILSYNNENSMACVLSIAYYYAHGDYIFQREFATGKGFADLVLLPRKNVDTPAIIIELKCRRKPSGSAFSPADEAIAQIKERHYWEKVSAYMQDHTSACKAEASLLLVGIGYDKEKKMHDCRIEYKKL